MAKSKLRVLTGTPLQHGFAFPAEWEPHSGTWFSWPRPEGISFPDRYHTVPANLAAIIREIAARESVHINVQNGNYEHLVREQLIAGGVQKAVLAKRVHFHHIKTNEPWCRDHGPAFVVRKVRGGRQQMAIVDWGFNAWGSKYPPWEDDDNVPTRIYEAMVGGDRSIEGKVAGIFYPKHEKVSVVMEGGSVEFNGAGTVMTSESCLLHENRNPKLSRAQIEDYLKGYYGQQHVLWLGDGIAGDDTNGHIDDLARFASKSMIVTTVEDDPRDENYAILNDNLRRLQLAKDQNGKPFEIVTLPMPGVIERDGLRLPATYANFYFVNGALLVPTYGQRKNDLRALNLLRRMLPKREVVPIDCRDLIWGLGSIHCLTQQQPRL
ncbi:agmatine deiminase [Planctomycetota bacterium]|nr:agmatine deiminase [Planctomycetota bacterium]